MIRRKYPDCRMDGIIKDGSTEDQSGNSEGRLHGALVKTLIFWQKYLRSVRREQSSLNLGVFLHLYCHDETYGYDILYKFDNVDAYFKESPPCKSGWHKVFLQPHFLIIMIIVPVRCSFGKSLKKLPNMFSMSCTLTATAHLYLCVDV